ncbi:MAG: sensor histidine kinase, partial [Alphaproteobacteria bacterium]
KQREYLADIRSSSDTLLAIIDDILDLASIDAGGLELKVSEVTADEIINAAVLGVRDRLTRANLRLDIDIAPDTGVFRADVKRLTQVLYNLLSNAIGFSEAGELITLSCRRTGGDIEISVEDRGCGMPEEYKQAAFNRFESDPRGSRHRGPGLGLSIVKNLVELHGGSVHLDSAPNEGTRVTVRIPADGPPKEVQVPDAAE